MNVGGTICRNCNDIKNITLFEDVKRIGEKSLMYYFPDVEHITAMGSCKLYHEFLGKHNGKTIVYVDDPAMLPNDWKPYAAVGFAVGNLDVSTVRGKKHLQYIKSNVAKLVNIAFEYPSLLMLICNNNLLTLETVGLYLEKAKKKGYTEQITYLQDYQQRLLSI